MGNKPAESQMTSKPRQGVRAGRVPLVWENVPRPPLQASTSPPSVPGKGKMSLKMKQMTVCEIRQVSCETVVFVWPCCKERSQYSSRESSKTSRAPARGLLSALQLTQAIVWMAQTFLAFFFFLSLLMIRKGNLESITLIILKLPLDTQPGQMMIVTAAF